MKAFFLILWTAPILLAGCGGAYHSGTPRTTDLQGPIADVWISSSGRALPIFHLDGHNYLLGEEGDRYAVCLKNHIDTRVEAVVSVDGRDVVMGRIADYKQDRGYVLLPGEEVCIEGFRRSLKEVAAFEFTRPDESYAARMGDAGNVGVIGIALFEELYAPSPPVAIASDEPMVMGDVGDAKGSATPLSSDHSARANRQNEAEAGLGTGYGSAVSSDAEIVPFVRSDAEHPQELLVLYYNNREGLERIGVVFSDDSDDASKPNPFPGSSSGDGEFAPPPPR